MADKLWVGAGGANWTSPGNWHPPGVPVSGDTVTITTAQVTADGVTLDGLTINLDSGDSTNRAAIIFNDTTVVTSTTTIVATGTQAALYVPGTLSFAGSITAAQAGGAFHVTGKGLLTLETGSQVNVGAGQFLMFDVEQGVVNDGAMSLDGGVLNLGQTSGSGTIALSAGANLYAEGPINSGQTILFDDANSVLNLADAAGFHAALSGVRPGVVITLPGVAAASAAYDPVGHTLTLSSQGQEIVAIPIDAPIEPLAFDAELVRGGPRIYTSDATRSWNGGVGSWFDAAKWSTEGPAPASMPLAGDTAVIDAGMVVINDIDVGQFGAVHDMLFILAGSIADPGMLSVANFTLDKPSSIVVTGEGQHGVVLLSGSNTFIGEASALSHLGSLTFLLDGDGTTGSMLIDDTGFVVAPTSTMIFAGGDVTNDGLISVAGHFILAEGASINGVGLIDIIDGGLIIIDGAVGSQQQVYFGDQKGTLMLGDLASFTARIHEFQQGNVIIVENVVADRGDYDSDTGVLTLFDDNTEVGRVSVWAATVFGTQPGNFVVRADGTGGTQIAYADDPLTVDVSMAVAAMGMSMQRVTLRELLVNAFGEVPAGFDTFTLSIAPAEQQAGTDESYWGQPQQTPPGAGVNPAWYVNGTRITADTASLALIDAAQIDEVEFLVGNMIPTNAAFSVTSATDASGNPTQITRYHIWNVDPSVNTYQAGQAPAGSSAMANSVATYANYYSDVLNENDCNWIADNVAAGLGATMPYNNYSNDPMENRSGGFWRIVHNGVLNPVADWSTLVQAGDVVRMGWESVGTKSGPANLAWHTTTIYDAVADPSSGQNIVTVYDNIQYRGSTSYIGLHEATYWTNTVPESITIYRLDTDGQYLIEGNSAREYIHGTVFNDLIRPVGGGVTVTGGPGDDEIEGTLASLNDAKLTDFTLGDWLDITDLDPTSATVSFHPNNDVLTIYNNGAAVASLTLSAWTVGDSFVVGSDGDGGTHIQMVHEERTSIDGSAFLNANGWSYTLQSDPAAAFGYAPDEVSPAAGEDKIVMGLMLQRANDPTALLEMGWAARQKALAAMEANGSLWTTYGADQQSYDSIAQKLTADGITILEGEGYISSAASRTIWVELNASEFRGVFGADLLAGNSDDRGRTLFWNGDLAVPQSWGGAVSALWLDSNAIPLVDNVLQGTSWMPPQGPQSAGNANTGAPALTPLQVAALYNFPILNPAAVTETIGVLEPVIGDAVPDGSPDGYFQSAFEAYRAALRIDNTATPFRYYGAANGGTTYSQAHAGERSMDVGILTAINPNANIGLYVGSGNDQRSYYSAFQSAIWDLENNPGILSSSFMDFVSSAPGSPYLTAYRELFVDAALRNMTLFSAAGDGGSSDSIPNGLTNVIQAHTSPFAVVVGGTSLSTAGTAAGDPTLSAIIAQAAAGDLTTLHMLVAAGMTDLPQEATALTRTIETVWNQIVLNGNAFSAGAGYYDAAAGVGGVDVTTPTPSYQRDYGLDPSDAATGGSGRGVPDVSAASGGNLTYYTPNGDLTLSPTNWSGGYGTSAAAPLWASLTAQVNAIFLDQGLPRLGYMNDLLYAAAVVAPASFNDVTLGNNIASFNWGGDYTSGTAPFVAIPGDTSNITPTGLGYQAGPGYDYVTGLGSPNGVLLARALTAIAHAQMNGGTPPMLAAGEDSDWTGTAAQSLLIQPMLATGGIVSVRAGDEIRAIEVGPSDAFAWSSQFAQQVLQPHFSAELVVAFDGQSQGMALEAQLAADAIFLLALDDQDMAAPQAALSNAYGFVDFLSDGEAVRAARAVAVAETVGRADDQVAIVRIRQNGVNDNSLLFYRVDDFAGTVDGIAPGEAGYAAATLARAYATAGGGSWVDGPGYGEYAEARLLDVDADDLVAMRLRSDGEDFYAFSQANEIVAGRGVGHLWNYGLNTWGWEDVLGGGDQDYNDMVVQLDFTSSTGAGWLA